MGCMEMDVVEMWMKIEIWRYEIHQMVNGLYFIASTRIWGVGERLTPQTSTPTRVILAGNRTRF